MSDKLWALGQFRVCSSPKAQGNSDRAISSKIVEDVLVVGRVAMLHPFK